MIFLEIIKETLTNNTIMRITTGKIMPSSFTLMETILICLSSFIPLHRSLSDLHMSDLLLCDKSFFTKTIQYFPVYCTLFPEQNQQQHEKAFLQAPVPVISPTAIPPLSQIYILPSAGGPRFPARLSHWTDTGHASE